MGPVAALVEEASEAGYLRSVRAGAVALRAAAEAFCALELKRAPPGASMATLGTVLRELPNYPGYQGLPNYRQGSARAKLVHFSNLGDSAAHQVLADESRRVQLIPSEIEDGVEMFERLLNDVYGWP
jgi:hypothetical protein